MPLDPVLKIFLDQIAAQSPPKLRDLPLADARAAFAGFLAAVGPKDIPIGQVANLVCPGPNGDIALRSYTPVAATAASLPTLVFFHGGGFVLGDLDTHDGLCRLFANEAGVRVIAVDYRLAPEHPFPAAVEDACAALAYVETHAVELGVDANRIAIGGDSAGGTLAAVVAQIAAEKGASGLAFQLLLFPATQIGMETASRAQFAEGYVLERGDLEWFLNAYLPNGGDKSDPRLTPLAAPSLAGLPPAYVMIAEYDPLHDEGLLYAEKLKRDGVDVEIADHTGLVHDFIYFHAVLPQAAQAIKDAAAALAVALKRE